MKVLYLPCLILTWTLATASTTSAQHSDHQNHGSMHSTTTMPTEPGDASFAAISEIVKILAQDPDTDWERVDIDALRVHLVDMTQLILGASVETEEIPNGLRMTISQSGRPGEAASRMVPAHGPVLASETGWSSTVVSKAPSEGFFVEPR
ncbi:conserved exported hypothetical protein [Roseovarius sp. EC-HK134]|uniref:hypothetical protein n=2 Tax=unclassified Roseovarius TaxID=2614913 RepID=UPI0012576E63|nr:hypothetical protein [Roseovarius sp. EC-HK134]VVS96560.1 conserved exported hypothetical protein [Roseovarius sp. EC-HK134]VVT00268.1 conserved exported hypothetical protein [Roseovarius sp. EC-SD190]